MHHSLSLPILLLSSAIVQAAVPESLAIPRAYLDSHPHPVHTTPPPAYAWIVFSLNSVPVQRRLT